LARGWIGGVWHAFALRGTDGVLEFRYELLTEGHWSSLLGHRVAFFGPAVIRSLWHEFPSPQWRKVKMPVIGAVHKMVLAMFSVVGIYSTYR
jgi:hypothetical protein